MARQKLKWCVVRGPNADLVKCVVSKKSARSLARALRRLSSTKYRVVSLLKV